MKLRILFLFLLSISTIAHGAYTCPELPSSYPLKWELHEGPDFVVCYAIHLETDKNLFAMYLGLHPDFEPDKSNEVRSGRVGKYIVTWYKHFDDHGNPTKRLQTLINVDNGDLLVHLWVNDVSESSISNTLAMLENIEL